MTTKMSHYDIRRRHHGEVLEEAMLEELIRDKVIDPIMMWDGLVRPKYGQPFFLSDGETIEQPLDEVAWVCDKGRNGRESCIIEVKAMRATDWDDWKYHATWHIDKNIQHSKHIANIRANGIGGVCIVALNKDSSECHIRVFDRDDKIQHDFEYDY